MQSKSTITASHENEENESMEESVFEQICDTIFVLIPEGVCTIFYKKKKREKEKAKKIEGFFLKYGSPWRFSESFYLMNLSE